MLLKLNEPLNIEDLGHHAAEDIRNLRGVLLRGAEARRDQSRNNFYEIEAGLRVFYIHISPSGSVLLLAMWAKDGMPLQAQAEMPLTHAATT